MTQEELIETILKDLYDKNLTYSSEDEEEVREILKQRLNEYFSEN